MSDGAGVLSVVAVAWLAVELGLTWLAQARELRMRELPRARVVRRRP